MPARSAVRGVEFVEFAAGAGDAADLAALFHALGFRASARHKSKAVTLYRQGGINIVVNTEGAGLAHSAFLVHGTSAYAIGLKVDDAHAAAARAVALGAETFAQPVAPGELSIPAIRGIGGGLIYFIDDRTELGRVWEIEFDPIEDEAAPRPAGLARIDHIAETMRADELSSWLLFYTSIFALAKTPLLDILDPGGLVRSQAVESADGALRITMNGAENRKTLAGHFIAESFGSSIQHLAFASDDIFATAAALAANGFRPLAIPRNYYDDIEARFGLDPDLADRLRRENILYDRDGDGEYFQFYSRNFGDGFFFEVVERRGGYRGYGAANAPFRIAAQQRHLKRESVPAI
jgi:4-hydroxyphenylpyruvate dioxygenase